jgi:L-cysteine S-thiosulfotransferase
MPATRWTPSEVSYGTLGPSLKAYGKTQGNTMRRGDQGSLHEDLQFASRGRVFEHATLRREESSLSEEQIKDVVAYLFAKDSPVNE